MTLARPGTTCDIWWSAELGVKADSDIQCQTRAMLDSL